MRRGYIGILNQFYLAGYTAGEKHAADETQRTIAIPADGMFYMSAFQGGIDHFVCHAELHDGAQRLSFLKKRFSTPKNDLEARALKAMAAFDAYRLSVADDIGFVLVCGFFSSLLGAMHHRAALLNVRALPQPGEIARVVAPELAAPLIHLVGQLQPLEESLPIPISAVGRSCATRLEAILESDAFEKYSKSHSALSDAKCDTAASMTSIRNSGRALIKRSTQLLRARCAVVHVLRIVPRIVDTIFGKLPGELAQLAGDVAQDRLRDRDQIVIYQCDQWMHKVSAMRTQSVGVVA